jgi:hypothetical protein
MKKLLFLFLFLSYSISAQIDCSDVMNLLIKNKREDARKLFDKKFDKIKDSHIDLLLLDGMIDQELGRSFFDETVLKKIEKLPNSEHFIPALINNEMIMGDIVSDGFNDLTFRKIDFLANSSKFKDLPIIKYRKAVSDRKRLDFENARKHFESLGVIPQWQFCGPFENMNSSGLHIEYEPELYAKNDKLFNASSNGMLGWFYPTAFENEGYHFFLNEVEYGSGIMYAQAFVKVPETKTYVICFGTSEGVKLFVDDVEISVKDEVRKSNLDGFSIKLNLNQGTHRIVFKVEIAGGGSYFSGSIKNTDLTTPTELTYYDSYQSYIQGKETSFNAEELKLPFETFIDELVKNYPNNILYKLLQFETYAANGKLDEAYDVIEGLDVKYPESSLISKYFIGYLGMEGDQGALIEEIMKNIENNDPHYHLVTFYKLNDSDWYSNASIKELEEYAKVSKSHKNDQYHTLFQMILASRKSDMDGVFNAIVELEKNSFNNDKNKLLLANIVKNLKNDNDKYFDILTEIKSTRLNNDVDASILAHYQKTNNKEKAEELMNEQMSRFFNVNFYRNQWIDYLIKENRYPEALIAIDENLGYFPYSFKNFEKKGYVYALMKNDKEAEKYYLKALSHHAADGSLRKKLYDLTNTVDEIEMVETKDIYKYIKSKRNTSLKGDYGVTILLDEYIVNILPEGGRKSKVKLIYEVTSESGIENMKEYSLNANGVNLTKNEIVKQNGSLVPGEVGYNAIIFPKLEVGDVIFIEYDYVSNSYGRFYNDFNISSTSSGEYPVLEFVFGIIYPENTKINSFLKNDQINVTNKKINKKNYSEWRKQNTPSVPIYEKFSPVYSDIIGQVYVGTINTWGDIANWYADLVKKNIKKDKITQSVFQELFPNGFQNLTEEERAKKIYGYISDNITYSFIDFRQSGHVPQKPSKTITTKLGDCKDVSTLFVTLAEMAGLEANLVLVLTNDNGLKSMALPNNEFNHCIAKVKLNGKDYFLELTDKYLPFKAMPLSLVNAKALVIHFQKAQNDKAQLIDIPADNALKNKIITQTIVEIFDDKKIFKNNHTVFGANKSYYNEVFSSATSEEIRKKEIIDMYNGKLKKSINFESATSQNSDKLSESITFQSTFSIIERLQKLGSLKVINIPFIDLVYTKALVESEKRNYPINYYSYEDSHSYESELILKLPNESKFVEIPESKNLSYKGHQYAIQFELIQNNELKISRKVLLSFHSISQDEYSSFKEYVDNVLEIEEQIIGFK